MPTIFPKHVTMGGGGGPRSVSRNTQTNGLNHPLVLFTETRVIHNLWDNLQHGDYDLFLIRYLSINSIFRCTTFRIETYNLYVKQSAIIHNFNYSCWSVFCHSCKANSFPSEMPNTILDKSLTTRIYN